MREASKVETPVITVIVPTRNEEGNVNALVHRAAPVLDNLLLPWEILFVDDSDDNTPEAVRRAVVGGSVRLLHREPSERVGGLSGAVLAGVKAARGDVIAVMDGDLQHPPEDLAALIAPLLDGASDISVATRYAHGGKAEGLDGAWRNLVSRGCRRLVWLALPRTRSVSDPLGGFFAFRHSVIEGVDLRPIGFKILLEILARGQWTDVSEVPYDFSERESGTSKAKFAEGLRFGRHLSRLAMDRSSPPTPVWRVEVVDLRKPGGGADAVIDLRDREPIATAPIRIPAWPPPYGSFVPRGTRRDDGVLRDLARLAVNGLRSARAYAVGVIALTVVAYHTTLGSLLAAWRQTSPIADIGLVAPLAAVLLVVKAVPGPGEPAIHDRQIDLLLGIPLLVGALITLGIDSRRSPLFWTYRIDLLSLPVFVAGLVTLLLGTRTMWRARWAIVFLVLAWPPALRALTRPIASLTAATGRAVSSVVVQLGVADRAVGTGAVAYRGANGPHFFHFTADAGTAQAVVAFALIGIAVSICVTASWRTKATWLVVGGTIVYLVEVGRLVAGFSIGRILGLSMPVVLGPVPDLVVALVTSSALAWFAVRQSHRRTGPDSRTDLPNINRAPIVTRMRGALAVVAAVGTLVFVQDSSLSSLSHIAGPLGDARIAALAPPPPVGSSRWEPVVFATTAPAFSPGGSNWARYAEVSDPAGSGQRAATVLDVVSSPGPGPLSAGDLRNWYPISEKVQEASVTTDLGSGVRAAFVSFRRRDGSSWVCLTWIWPVMGTGSARFERVVLIPARLSAVGPSSLASGWLSAGEVVATKPNLKAIARALVSAQLRVTKASSSGTNNWLEAS